MEDEYDIEKTDSNAVKNHNEPEKVGGRRCCGKKMLCCAILFFVTVVGALVGVGFYMVETGNDLGLGVTLDNPLIPWSNSTHSGFHKYGHAPTQPPSTDAPTTPPTESTTKSPTTTPTDAPTSSPRPTFLGETRSPTTQTPTDVTAKATIW